MLAKPNRETVGESWTVFFCYVRQAEEPLGGMWLSSLMAMRYFPRDIRLQLPLNVITLTLPALDAENCSSALRCK